VRWRNNQRTRRFFSDDVMQSAAPSRAQELSQQLHRRFADWGWLAKAQYLETKLFLSQYLLSSQGDRMAMAHSVEGRFPFLDYRVVEFCNRLPPALKLRGLTDKYLLRKLGQRWLPQEIWTRRKHPYRAPIHRCFCGQPRLDYVEELLAPPQLERAGLFKPAAVSRLLQKVKDGLPLGETDDMALVGIISTQLLHHQFVTDFVPPPPLAPGDRVKVCHGPGLSVKGNS
jgi:asparagine synthase (glutamine-hydrolysing)